jgi:hypothetical protein
VSRCEFTSSEASVPPLRSPERDEQCFDETAALEAALSELSPSDQEEVASIWREVSMVYELERHDFAERSLAELRTRFLKHAAAGRLEGIRWVRSAAPTPQ